MKKKKLIKYLLKHMQLKHRKLNREVRVVRDPYKKKEIKQEQQQNK